MRSLASEDSEAVEGFMDSFIISARVRIGDKQSVEKRIKDAVNGSVHYSIFYSRLMDISRLRVGDIESFIVGVAIGFSYEVSVQCEDIIHQMQFELLDIFFLLLSLRELFPGEKQIIERDDIIISGGTSFLYI